MLAQASLVGLVALTAAAPVENFLKRDAQITFKKGVSQQRLGGQGLNFTLDTSGDYALLTAPNSDKHAPLQSLVNSGYSPDKSSDASDTGKYYHVEVGQYGHIPELDAGNLYKDTIEVAGKSVQDYPFVLSSEKESSDNYLDLSFNGTLAKKLGNQLQFSQTFDRQTSLVDTEVKIGSFSSDSLGDFVKVNDVNEIDDVELTFEGHTSKEIKAVLDFGNGYTTTPSDLYESFPFSGWEGGGVRCNATGPLQLKIGNHKYFLSSETSLIGEPLDAESKVCNSWFEQSNGDMKALHIGANLLQNFVVTYDFDKSGVFFKLA